jgi:DNA-binding transcriptional ArsR family regulator
VSATNSEKERPAYWAILPATVRYDKELPASAKLIYAEISALSGKTGFCFASNEYLMQLFDVSERALQRHLKALEERGLVQIIDGDGGAGRRKIFAGINPLANPDKNDGVTPTKMSPNPDKNVAHINKSIKKENQEPPIVPQRGTRRADLPDYRPDWFEAFWKAFPPMKGGRKPAKARARAAWNKLRPDRSTVEQMATALRRQKSSEQWQAGIGIPYASTWLNGRMWEEEFVEPAPVPEPGTPSGRRDMQWL